MKRTTLRTALAIAAFSLACSGLSPSVAADEPGFTGCGFDRTKIGQSGGVYTWRPGC